MSDRLSDRERLERAMASVQELQALALEYGIDDIFQDNGGKVLQSLIILGLRQVPGREGNDAVDQAGLEYELKTVNVLKQKQVTTHHHLNHVILRKYRNVAAWYISLYEGISLREIYRVEPRALEGLFDIWEKRIDAAKGSALNNPKIPLTLVADAAKSGGAQRVYPPPEERASQAGDSFLEKTLGQRRSRLKSAVAGQAKPARRRSNRGRNALSSETT